MPAPNLGAPFNDGTGAVGLPGDASAYVAPDGMTGSVGADDFALEVVLRAATGASVLDKHVGATGWWLHEDAGGQLLLDLGRRRDARGDDRVRGRSRPAPGTTASSG